MKNKLRVVFFGTPNFVDPIIEKLKQNFNVVAEIRDSKEIINNKLSIINNVDFFVVAAYGQILPPEVLEIPKLGTINIHPSLLPHYRGPSPIQSAILNGDKKTGITFFKMDEKIDHGPILQQFEEPISENDTFESLAIRLFDKSANDLVRVLRDYKEIKPKPQDESKASYTKLLTRNDGYIDMQQINNQMILARRIRAYYPWPSVWTRSSIINNKSSIIKFLPAEFIQVEGKKPMSYKDFINGYEKGRDFLATLKLI